MKLLAFLLLAALPAAAQIPMPPGKWWKQAEFIQQLSLADEQVRQLEAVFQDSRKKFVDLKAEVEKRQGDLEALLESPAPDEKKLAEQLDFTLEAQVKMMRAAMGMMLRMRLLLKPAQWQKLEALQHVMQMREEEMRQRMMMFPEPTPSPRPPEEE